MNHSATHIRFFEHGSRARGEKSAKYLVLFCMHRRSGGHSKRPAPKRLRKVLQRVEIRMKHRSVGGRAFLKKKFFFEKCIFFKVAFFLNAKEGSSARMTGTEHNKARLA